MNMLEKLKELQEAATPGPWDREGFYNVLRIAKKSLDWELVNPTEDTLMPDEKDAEYIVTLHNALPALIEVAEAAKWVRETTNHAYVLNQAAVKGALKRLDAALAKLEVEK